MIKQTLPALALLAALVLGCDSPELEPRAAAPPAPAPAAAPEPKTELVAGIPGPPVPDDETPVTDVPRKFTKKDPIKGRRTSAQGGVAGNFGAAIRAEFEMFVISIDEANQLYWPQHDFSYPKTHDAFMRDVVAQALNGKTLPEIPEDEEYIYVPDQAEVGLQIRLIPGSARSKIPAAAPGKEHVFEPQVLAAAGVVIPTAEDPRDLSPDPRIRAQQIQDRQQGAQQPAAGGADAEPSPNIRERAAQIGNQGNSRADEHGLAPGGLAPVGGLGVGDN